MGLRAASARRVEKPVKILLLHHAFKLAHLTSELSEHALHKCY